MPRKPLIRDTSLPYHVVNQCDNREHFPADLKTVWMHFCAALWEANLLMGAEIHSFVLMPNHYHLIVSCPDRDLGEVMRWVGRSVTEKHNRSEGRCGHLFRGRYHWSLIRDELYLSHAYKYVYRNPVRAGLCHRVEDWPHSSLQFKTGREAPLLKLTPARSFWITEDLQLQLDWLNFETPRQESESIRAALRRREFKLPVNRTGRHTNRLRTTSS